MKTRMRCCLLCTLSISLALAADRKEIDVSADQVWTDTDIDLKAGDALTITAAGTVQYDGARATGPEGLARARMDLMMQLPVNGSGRGALVGRFGGSPAARPFLIGPRTQRTVLIPSRLLVGTNQMANAPGKEAITSQ